jgi:lipoprotein-releasing system ATP-binding protein
MPGDSLRLSNVSKTFSSGDASINVLDNVNLVVRRGESVALVGESGTGKSTLLQIAALLETQTSGDVFIDGVLTNNLSDFERTKIRRNNIGFVYQFHNLLPEFSAIENVVIPQVIGGTTKNDAICIATELLCAVGLSDRLHHPSQKLSGGERQRVAVARAVANNPKLVVADEPTGSLDPNTSAIVFDLLIGLVKTRGISMIVATHNLELAKLLDSIVNIKELPSTHP